MKAGKETLTWEYADKGHVVMDKSVIENKVCVDGLRPTQGRKCF